MATICIHYIFFPSLQSNSIKNYSLSLNVESDKFFLTLSSWVSFTIGVVVVIGVIGVVIVVDATAMKTDGLEKFPMNSHLLHLQRRIHD